MQADARLLCASEETTHRAIVAHLAARSVPGVVYFHPANGEGRTRAAGGRLKAMGVRAGIPDLCMIHDGRAYFLEIKRASGGRVSVEQSEMHAALVAAGAVVAVVHGLDRALDQLVWWGIIR